MPPSVLHSQKEIPKMTNPYYSHEDGVPAPLSRGQSGGVRAELDLVAQGFALLPTPAQLWADNANYVPSGGTADAWTATMSSQVASMADGMQVRVKFGQANTSLTPTLNVNTLGAKTIVGHDGSALVVGSIAAGMTITLTYDLSTDKWRLAPGIEPAPSPDGPIRTTALADGAVINWDTANGRFGFLTLSTTRLDRQLANLQNAKDGVQYSLIVTQNPAGGQNFTSFGNAIIPVEDITINQAANSVTVLHLFCVGGLFYVAKHGGTSAGVPAPAPAPGPAPAPPPAGGALTAAFAAGVNLSGMEWASPGVRFGTSDYPNLNYTVPRAADISYLASQGVTLVRLPIQWELLQPLRASCPANTTVVAGYNSSLGTHVKGGFWEPMAQYITKILDACQAAGTIKCILDIHNYCRYKDFKYQADGSVLGFVDPVNELLPPYTSDNTQVVSTIFAKVSPTLTQADFTDLWTKIATRWSAHAGLGGYSLMNEPHDMPAVGKNFGVNEYPVGYPSPDFTQDYTIWPTYAQAAVTAIRSIDGNTPIYVGGNDYQAPMSWATVNPGFPLAGARIIYDFHLYLDATSGGFRFDWDDEVAKGFSAGEGGVPISSATGTNRINPILTWAAAHGNPVLACTEFGIPIENTSGGVLDTRWLTAAAATLNTLKSNNIQTFTWMGGNHWPIHAYPINHVPKWYQNTTVEPIAGAYLKNKLVTNLATIFDEGGQYSSGGAAVSVTVQARGNLTTSVGPITVTAGGTGYTGAPTVTISAPQQAGGVQATATATFSGGAVTAVNITNAGSGYNAVPTVTFSGGAGTGAAATATLNPAVTLTVASDNGGSLSKSTLTLAAGVNSVDTYTFTPAANSVTTLSYTRSGGGQKPPNRVVYSLTDPVTYAATNLAAGAKAILAKYGAACWLARDAYKDYLTPTAAACVAGDYVRAIADSGSGSTIVNPMEAINWLNQDAGSVRGTEVPVVYNPDPNGFPALDFSVYGRRGLLSRHLAPVVAATASDPNYRYPACKMPFNLTDPHFMVTTFSISTAGVDGTLLSAQEIFASSHSAIMLSGGKVRYEAMDANGIFAQVTDGVAQPLNTLVTATANVTAATQKLRVNGGAWEPVSPSTAFVASPFSTVGLGMGYWNYFPQQTTQGYGYGYIVGPGTPTDAEVGVLENYLKSFAQAAGPTDPGEIAIQTQFSAGNLGWWGDNRSLSEFLAQASVAGVPPVGWTDLIGAWINHGNKTNGHDLVQTDNSVRFQLGTDGGGLHYVHGYNGAPLKNVGGSTTAFYACIALDVLTPSYDCNILSSRSTANTGITLEQEAFAATFIAKFGTGSALVTVTSPAYAAGSNNPAGKNVVEIWFDGTNCAIRLNKGTPATAALSALSAGNADLLLLGNYPLTGSSTANSTVANVYEAVVFKNYCPNSTDRDAICTWVASKAGLTV
jgi:aryl-phospho-beta-D-glucosidase BglC (GH1 family)